jgi:hypothetical protein
VGRTPAIFLLAALKKGERSDSSQAEKNELRKELAGLGEDFRRTVKAKALELKRRRRWAPSASV